MLLVAGSVGWIFRKLGLSAVVGFLVAGIIIGPYTPPFTLVSDVARVQALSELGLVFLMFFVGLGLSLRRIKRLGLQVVLATALTALGVFGLSQVFASLMGWNHITGVIFAAMLMTSSSAIIVKMLAELGLTHERFALNAQGITLLEDIVAVVMLTVIGSKIHMAGESPRDSGHVLVLLLGFTSLSVVLGLIFVPRLLQRLGKASNADLKAVVVSGMIVGAGVASISAGFSVALGAFLFGVVVAETPFKSRIEKRLAGAQDMFSAIFFVSIGMLIDVRAFWDHAGLILGVSIFAIVIRVLASSMGLLITGAPVALAASSAIVLTPIGEFSYIIAQVGVGGGLVPDSFYALAVGTSLVTAALVPFFAKCAERFGVWVDKVQPSGVRVVLEGYGKMLERAAIRSSQLKVWQLTRRRVGLTIMEVLMFTGVLGLAEPARNGIVSFLERTGYPAAWLYVFWGVVIAISVMLLTAIWRSLSALSMIYAEVLTMRMDQASVLRPLVQYLLQTVCAGGLGALAFFLFPVHTAGPWLAGILILAVVLIVGVLWRKIIRLHSRFETSLAEAVDQGGGSRVVRMARDGDNGDWGMDVAEIVLPDQAACAGRTIKDLAVRSRFGCTILEIDRQGFIIANPKPDTPLYPGDRVLVFGAEKQIAQARVFFSEEKDFREVETDFDESVLEVMTVPENSYVAGKSLAELEVFRRTGVQVMGIEKGGRRILNPHGAEVLEGGCRLLLIGTDAELRAFREWMEPRENRGERPVDQE